LEDDAAAFFEDDAGEIATGTGTAAGAEA